MEEVVPIVVANCKILRKLGQGGMGSVYRSVHQTLGRNMAIKILPAEFTRSPEYVSRFLREARAIANLNHPNIVLVHDAGEQNGIYYIAMEMVDGASLAAITRHSSRLPEPIALDFLSQSAKGLGYAHDRGLVHRDIKPENLLVNREGTLKVVDFGLVLEAASQSHLTRTGTFLGTPTFMSPEQCDGDVADARSDLYSLGATFYCILTGRAPFTATSPLGIMYKHKFDPPPPLDPHISAQTTAIIMKLLAKKREDRYQTAKELLADVAQVLRVLPPETAWTLDQVLSVVAPPLPEPTPEELGRSRTSSETVAMRGAPVSAANSAGTVNEYPSPGPSKTPSASAAFEPTLLPSSPPKSAPSWDPTVVFPRTPAPPGSTPAPAPVPGTATPPPSRAKSRTGLWLGLAAVLLVGIALGGFFAWQSYRESQLNRYVQNIEALRKAGNLDDAKDQLVVALTSFPDHPQLTDLRKTLNADIARKIDDEKARAKREARAEFKVERLSDEAKAAFENKRYDEAIQKFQDALKLAPDSEELNTRLRRARLENYKVQINRAEADRKWKDALDLARQSLEVDGEYEQVQRLEQRLSVEKLRNDALRLSNDKDLLAAADKFDEAANFSTRDPALRDELLQFAVQQRTTYHLNLATEAEGQRKWTAAIAALNTAHKLAPKDAAIEERIEKARATFRNETSFDSAMALGQKAMAAQKWAEAAEMYRAATGHNKDHAEAKAKLAEALNRDVLSQSEAKVQAKLWGEARTMLDQIKADIGKMGAEVKIDYDRLSTLIQTNQDEIASKVTRAETASKNGPLQTAIQEYEALVELNPADRATYEKRLAPLRVEHAFQKFLADGDQQAKDGQFANARNAYQQAAAKKKDDAVAQATVNSRLAVLVASEKLFKIEPLIAAKNWADAQTQLTAIQKELPADNREAQTTVAARLKTVNDALAQIGALEETGNTAIPKSRWDEGRKALKELLNLNPSKKDAYQKQLDDLEKAFKEFNEQAARQARYDQKMGEARQKLGQEDFDAAIADANIALQAKPEDVPAKALVKEAQEKKEAKALAKLLNDTHQNVAGLLSNGRLDEALKAAQTAAQQNPTAKDLGTMASALKELQPAKSAVATASKPLEDGRALVAAQAPENARSLQKELQSAKERLAQQEAAAQKQFSERNYVGAQNTAAALSTGAANQARAALETVAAALDKLGQEAAAAVPNQSRRTVGENDVDAPPPAKADPAKARPYTKVSESLRALAQGLR